MDSRQIIVRAATTSRRSWVSQELYSFYKRIFDFFGAIALLVFLSPLLLVIALGIKLDTPGPILFIQERAGSRRRYIDGETIWEIRNFRMYKFRSMVHNADQSVHQAYIRAYVSGQVTIPNPNESTFKLSNDKRVTRVGRWLRRSSMDELPQLINVLKGEMSLVGPRPVPTYEFDQYQSWHRERMAALPGMTGLWQVKARCQVPFEEQIRMDIEYVRTQSFWLDIKLLLLTIPVVMSRRGAE